MNRYKSCTVGSLQYNDAGAMAPASSRRGRSRGSIGQRHPDALEGRVLLQGVVGLVAPVAGLLHPAEGHGLVPAGPVIDEYLAGVEPTGDAHDAVDVLAPEPRRQAVDAVVGHGHGLLLRIEAEHREHRAEDLLLPDGHLGGHAVEYRGRDEEPSAFDLGGLAAGAQPGALLAPLLDVAQDAAILGRSEEHTSELQSRP